MRFALLDRLSRRSSTGGLIKAGTLMGFLLALGAIVLGSLTSAHCAGTPPPKLVPPFDRDDADSGDWAKGFSERRGFRRHKAVDIPAPRNTPVRAVADGRIDRLRRTSTGGISIEQTGPKGRHCFYYAHLERYAEGLAAGQPVRQGQVIGFVGSSGNAPDHFPHLHLAVHRLNKPGDGCWSGTPIDPYPLLR